MIFFHPLYSSPATTFTAYVTQFNSVLQDLLDKHAPLKTISCRSTPNKPYITDEIKKAKSLRSKLETIYRKTKSSDAKSNFKRQA